MRSAKEEAHGFRELTKELEKRNALEQKLKRVERKLEKAAKALMRKRGIGSARSSAKNLPPPSWRPVDPNYIMNSVQVAPLMSSGYGNTARFRTHYDATITRTAECDEAPRMKELNTIIDNGPHRKVAAEFTTFAEAAAQLGIVAGKGRRVGGCAAALARRADTAPGHGGAGARTPERSGGWRRRYPGCQDRADVLRRCPGAARGGGRSRRPANVPGGWRGGWRGEQRGSEL